jgi:hypothetical protein
VKDFTYLSFVVLVKNVTSCYLIDLCGLCGTNPIRGVCYPGNGTSQCKCFVNGNDPSRPYEDDLCYTSNPKSIVSTSFPWTPIIIGILASFAVLFCAITSYLLFINFSNHRGRRDTQRPSIHRDP